MRDTIQIVSIVNILDKLQGKALKILFQLVIPFSILLGCSQPYEEVVTPDADASGKFSKHKVTNVVLVDAVTNLDIGTLTDSYTFVAAAVNVRAESDGASVVFTLSGAESHRQVENVRPFSLKGDNSGNYVAWIPKAGTYSLTVTPYAGADGTGREGISKTVRFTVTNPVGESPLPPPPPPVEYYFNQDFTGVSLSGTGSSRRLNGWNILQATAFLDDATVWAYKPPYTDIRLDNTFDNGRQALYFRVNDKDPSDSWTTRTQMSLTFKDLDLGVYHTSHRMYLSPDLQFLTNFSGTLNWVDIFEVWNKRNPNWDGDQAGSSRISMYINKEAGVGQPLYWQLSSQYAQPQNILWNAIWPTKTNKTVPVPIGKWFTLDVYLKRGEGANGHFKVILTPDNGQPEVLFDVRDHTVYPGHPELTLKTWQPLKFYFSDSLLDWLRANNKVAYAYYNDFKWFKQ